MRICPFWQFTRLNPFSYANNKGFEKNKAKLGKAPHGFLAASQAQQTPELWENFIPLACTLTLPIATGSIRWLTTLVVSPMIKR